MSDTSFAELSELARYLRSELGKRAEKKPDKSPFVLLYAFNGTGKTRLSTAFKDLGKVVDANGETTKRDTLYFNAYTEDLFNWDNDLEGDRQRVLELNDGSTFFEGLRELEMEVKIGKLLDRYTDFNFYIDYDRRKRKGADDPPNQTDQLLRPAVTFFRQREESGDPIPIKVSRGEENIFIWCFFLAILQLALDGDPAYEWVENVFIDDPVSSLDEHNAILIGNHLVQLYREAKRPIRTVVSTHHTLFFNVLHYELRSQKNAPSQYTLKQDRNTGVFQLKKEDGDTPQFYHIAALADLWDMAEAGTVSTYHFNVLRSILEKTAFFLGYGHFSKCIKTDDSDADGVLHQRYVDLLSHGKYSMYEPIGMGDDTMDKFRTILRGFVARHPFNRDLLSESAPDSKES